MLNDSEEIPPPDLQIEFLLYHRTKDREDIALIDRQLTLATAIHLYACRATILGEDERDAFSGFLVGYGRLVVVTLYRLARVGQGSFTLVRCIRYRDDHGVIVHFEEDERAPVFERSLITGCFKRGIELFLSLSLQPTRATANTNRTTMARIESFFLNMQFLLCDRAEGYEGLH